MTIVQIIFSIEPLIIVIVSFVGVRDKYILPTSQSILFHNLECLINEMQSK